MIKITFHYRYRKQIIIAGTILIFITITSILYISNRPKAKLKIKEKKIALKKDKKETKDEVIEEYKVDIKGEVVNPGIYTLKSTSRIIDQTTPNMIQRIIGIFERKPLISKEI